MEVKFKKKPQTFFKKLIRQLTHMQTNTLENAIELIYKDAKALVPIRTGTLYNSIQKEITENTARVYTDCAYGLYIEIGTGQLGRDSPSPPKFPGATGYSENWKGIPAQPYLWPAYKQNEKRILEHAQLELHSAIKRSQS